MIELQTAHRWCRLSAIVGEATEEDAAALLNEAERAVGASFRLAQRRSEWLASRIAAKLAAARLFGIDADKVSLLSGARGALATGAGSSAFVSYSHTSGLGAAAVDDGPVGVDLERIRTLDRRVTKFFLSESERQVAESIAIGEALIHFWSAKEAAFKMFGRCTLLTEVSLELTAHRDDSLEFLCSHGGESGTVVTSLAGRGYILALSRIVPRGDSV